MTPTAAEESVSVKKPRQSLKRRPPRGAPPVGAQHTDGSLITPDDAALYLQVGRSTLKRWVHNGEIEFVRCGRLVRFTKAGLDRWIAKQTRVPVKKAR
jgi:excisionase family DNA binding protein